MRNAVDDRVACFEHGNVIDEATTALAAATGTMVATCPCAGV